MGQRGVEAVRGMARCFRSTLMGQILRRCIVLRQHFITLDPIETERIRTPVWFYPATHYMARQFTAAIQAMAPYSPLTPVALVSRRSITSLRLLLRLAQAPTVTEVIQEAI